MTMPGSAVGAGGGSLVHLLAEDDVAAPGVVGMGEIGAVVGAAALLAHERRLRDEPAGGQEGRPLARGGAGGGAGGPPARAGGGRAAVAPTAATSPASAPPRRGRRRRARCRPSPT